MNKNHLFTKFFDYINEQIISDEDKVNLQLNKFKERKDFTNKKFTLIGKGSARLVYDINNEYVLKLAKNNKGIAQNKVEINISKSNKYNDIIAKVVEFNDNGNYLIQQKAKSISDDRFEELTGLQYQGFLYYLRFNKEWSGENRVLFDTVSSLIDEFDLDRFDVASESSWGEINGRVVLIDYGLDKNVAKKHYGVSYY